MKSKFYFLFIIFIFSVNECLFAQLGRKNTYEFLSMPVSSRITGLGGIGTLIKDDDVNLASNNPSLLNDKMNGSISFNHNFYFAGISNGHVGFAKKLKGMNYHAGLTYVSYGDFKATNQFDEDLGLFKASERAVVVGASRKLNDRFDAGVNLRTVFSTLETYKSFGLAGDAALTYSNDDKKTMITFLIKNLGRELSSYTDKNLSAPLDIQIGFSKRLKYLPLRFSIFGHQLQQWDVRYDDPDEVKEVSLLGESNEPSPFSKNIDNLFRHLIFNGELSIGKNENLKIRGAYSHLRRQELNLSTIRSMAGFSIGFGLKIKKFTIDYGLGYHHLAGAANHLSIYTNLDRFKKNI
jgi:hypothetical protein